LSIDIDKKLLQIVCICKGINLRRVLKCMQSCDSISDVNRAAGTGSGGCQGQRCGPRIRILLDKKKALIAEPESVEENT
jgi:bacterioferritin-associated ferredoxin